MSCYELAEGQVVQKLKDRWDGGGGRKGWMDGRMDGYTEGWMDGWGDI